MERTLAYSPLWEPLSSALNRIMLGGVAEPAAKTELATAIAERQVAVRVQVDPSDPDVGGQVLDSESVSAPKDLTGHDLEWSLSRPNAAWQTGPSIVEGYTATWRWKPRPIEWVEVSTDNVTRLWCSDGERFARRAAAQAETQLDLPAWLSPMEAVAWIVSRRRRIVGYANPECNAWQGYFTEHKLPDGKRVEITDSLPPGMTVRWLDLFSTTNRDAALPSDAALTQLLDALRTGRITARAIWAATGERRDMGSDEWHGVTLDNPPRNERVLLPHRAVPGRLGKQIEDRWDHVLFPTAKLLELWPGGEVVNPPAEAGARSALTASPPQQKPPVAEASLVRWYTARRDSWPATEKHPSQDEDLIAARNEFPDKFVSREAIRTVRAAQAPPNWKNSGRRKLARENSRR